jgi:hypothetical protein
MITDFDGYPGDGYVTTLPTSHKASANTMFVADSYFDFASTAASAGRLVKQRSVVPPVFT